MHTGKPLYFDYNATTPIDPAVRSAMLPYLDQMFGNPSSMHQYGIEAHRAVEKARRQVAALINAEPDEIVFTGSGSEASNLAIKGSLWPLLAKAGGPRQIITTAIEHPATSKPCQFMRSLGFSLVTLPVDRHGVVDLGALQNALKSPTALVSIMHSNNEVGTLQPIDETVRLARQTGAIVHCDAAQSLGKLPVDVRELDIDLLTIAGHKLYAPKGVGALFVKRGITLEPLVHGAGHEAGRRAGTENVPYLVALGQAAELAQRSLPQASAQLLHHRDRFWSQLHHALGERAILNGHPRLRLPNTLNISFAGWIGSELLACLPEIAASTGSACHEGHISISPVLQAMGIEPRVAQGAVRLSVGRFTMDEEVDTAAQIITRKILG